MEDPMPLPLEPLTTAPPPAQALPCLDNDPPLFYLLREFETTYRHAPTGGSAPIRGHMRMVRERLAKVMRANPAIRLPQPVTLAATSHLDRALDNGEREPTEIFVRAAGKVVPRLRWELGYSKISQTLARKFAYADILGPAGFVESEELVLGFVLFAPGCVYPSHRHEGITESYIVLSGAVSENDLGVFRPPSMIFNAAGTTHTIRTSSNEPALLAYAWTGTHEAIAGHTMRFVRARRSAAS